MTVATRDYGAKDFDYPVIELSNYSASFTKAKVIGDDENPKNEGKAVQGAGAAKQLAPEGGTAKAAGAGLQ